MKRMKLLNVFFVFVLLSCKLYGQTVEVTIPALAGQDAKLYYFAGAAVDSVFAHLDSTGKAKFSVPGTDYRGMVYVKIAESSGIELVVAEPLVKVSSSEAALNIESVDLSATKENTYLKRIFTGQSRNLQKQAWLKAGAQFYDAGQPLLQTLEKEMQAVENAISALETDAAQSPLYAAAFYRLNGFMNHLFEAEQQADKAKALLVETEMETSLDVAALYRSGQLWGSVHNFYINLFNRLDERDKHRAYAHSILRTLGRLQTPYYEAFLTGSLTETERFGWKDSQDTILTQVLAEHPDLKTDIPFLKSVLTNFRTKNQRIAPSIEGLPDTSESFDRLLVAFYDSDCNTCENEMRRIAGSYQRLKAKGFRVVSIAADKVVSRFKEGGKDFPWPDKLCDFKGFEGENFRNFGVMATPTLFVVDKEGKILQECYGLDEVK